jgi:integrase
MVQSKKIFQGRLLKQPRTSFPSLGDLELVKGKIKQIPNQKGEFLRGVHYGCYLLCSQAGLRVSEAVRFDLNAKNKQGLYRIEKSKGKKERLVYVNKEVVQELKSNY